MALGSGPLWRAPWRAALREGTRVIAKAARARIIGDTTRDGRNQMGLSLFP